MEIINVETELNNKKDVLNKLLKNNHQQLLGTYREALIRDFLINFIKTDEVLKKRKIKVGTGLVIGLDNEVSKQIDILIYDNSVKEKFKINEFCVVDISKVIACIEIKSNLNKRDISSKNGALENVKKLREIERKYRKPNEARIHYSIFSYKSPSFKNLKKTLQDYYSKEFDSLFKEYLIEYKQIVKRPTATRFTPDLILSLDGYNLFIGDSLTRSGMLPCGFISKEKKRKFGTIQLFYSMLLNSISDYFQEYNPNITKLWNFTDIENDNGYSIRDIMEFDWKNPIFLKVYYEKNQNR